MPETQHAGLHYQPAGFDTDPFGHLLVAGVRAETLAERHGTPLYVYNAGDVGSRLQALRSLLPPGVRLHYAVKANPNPALLERMTPWLDGMDVASTGEMRRALAAGIRPGNLSLAGPGKTQREIEAAIREAIIIGVESPVQLQQVAETANRLDESPKVSIRINPDFRIKAAGMHMGGGASAFGVDSEEVPELLAQARDMPLRVVGFQIYAGSQNLHAQALVNAQARSLELILETCPAWVQPEFINLGGGFGIPYFPGDAPLDVAHVARALEPLRERLQDRWPHAALVLELGRYLVGESGIYVARVLEQKYSRGERFIVVDGGLHHHLAATGNLGQVIRRNYPVGLINRLHDAEDTPANVVGPLCTPLDCLARRVLLPRAEAGDLVGVFQSGAYGLTASPTAFLDHPLPAEVVL